MIATGPARIGLIALLCLAGVLHDGVAQAGLAKPVIGKLPNGAISVVNTGPSRWVDTNGWKLVYERTVQPAEGEPGVLESPWGTALSAGGYLATIDFRNVAVRLYGPDGKFLRAIGRRGEGPGEYRVPFAAFFKDSLYVYDPQLRRASVFTVDGKLARTVATTANDQYPIHFDARGMMVLRASTFTRTQVTARWVYQTRTGQKLDSMVALGWLDAKSWKYVGGEGPSEWTIPFPPTNIEQLLPTGGAVIGRTDDYALVVTRTGTDTVRRFSRVNPPLVRIPEATRDSALQANVRQQPKLRGIARLEDVPTHYAPWRGVYLDASGNFWVHARTERSDRTRFDVYTPDGVLLGAVVAPIPAAATVNFHGDRLAVIDTDADDLPRIRIFRIDRRGK
ncbi:MAG: hypothetical protein IPO52_10140 [Gemmatimonadetes bacterium]|nr:hypothetical protein [Gemmatimonadota bacterium]